MIYFWTIIIYLLLLVAVGFYKSGQVKTQEDFMVAGRRLSGKVLVGTLLATWIGSGSIIGAAGLAYRKGFSALWFDAGVWIAIIVLYLIAGRVRKFAQFTVPDMLEARYNVAARVLGSLVTIIAYTAIVSYQFKTAGGWSGVTAKLSAEHFQILGSMSLTEALSYSLPSMLLLLGESNMYQRL